MCRVPRTTVQPPRPKKAGLLSGWLLTRYLITGLYVGAATVGAFVWWYVDKGVTVAQLMHWGACKTWPGFAHSDAMAAAATSAELASEACEVFTSRRAGPQALSLTVLVTIELLKALSAVSLTQSMFSISPLQNPYLLLGVAIPFLMHLAVLYVPALSGLFGLHPLSGREWKVVLALAAPILMVEEVLKGVGRAHSSRASARARAQQQQQQQQRHHQQQPQYE